MSDFVLTDTEELEATEDSPDYMVDSYLVVPLQLCMLFTLLGDTYHIYQVIH